MKNYLCVAATVLCSFPTLFLGSFVANATAEEATATAVARSAKAEIEFTSDVVYGQGDEIQLHLDIARPRDQDEASPCVLFIHGGGWRMGDKSMHVKQIKSFAENGYVAATVQYRFCPQHKFPAQVEDVKCAVRFLRANAEEYGIDKKRIGAIGFSAGAHLAMMLGAMDKEDGLEGDGGWEDQSSKVQAVVSYFGPTDLRSDEIPSNTAGMLKDFLGGTRDEQREAYAAASPASYINAGDPPMLLFQGTNDPLVPYTQAMQMATEMTAAGVLGRVELLMKKGHGWGGADLQRTERATYRFFGEHLAK